MPAVWIGKVQAPKEIFQNLPFTIKYREWVLVWPWKTYKIISRVTKESTGEVFDRSYLLKHWWFWGYEDHSVSEPQGLLKEESYLIEVGYDK